jgi:hypothetical protein
MAAWEYWNEMNPDLPTDRFYSELGKYLEEIDVYGHIRTTSTWGPSPKDCRHDELDLADTHFYLRPTDRGRLEDEVHAIVERTAWLRQHAPRKPAHLGEFGLADDQWRITADLRRSPELADVHNALWASALSGASGTALFWWWERLDERNAYHLYGPVSRFVAEIPWNSGLVQTAAVHCARVDVRVLGLRADQAAWLWCYSKEAAWSKLSTNRAGPAAISDCSFELRGFDRRPLTVEWVDTARGLVLRSEQKVPSDGVLQMTAPPFARDLAVRVRASE